MTKSRWRESIKSLGSSHIDPEKDEQLTKTKLEIDDKVAKIIKLIRNKNQRKKDGNLTKDSELLELIGDLHRQYQSLYSLYDNLRGEVKEKVQSLENKEGSSSTPSSGSESESYYSVDEASARSSPKHHLLQKVRDEFKQKLETSSTEFVDLRNKLNSVTEEKEAIHSEYMESLSKIEESENIIKELRNEVEVTESTKQKLVNECKQLKEKLVERENEFLSLTKANLGHETKIPNRIKGLERQVSSMKFERKNLCSQNRELEEKAEAQTMETKQLGEENSGLRAQILELQITSKGKEDEVSALMIKLEERGRISDSRIQDLTDQVSSLTSEVDSLVTQKEEVVFRSKQLEEENSGLWARILELEIASKEKDDELSALVSKLEESGRISDSRIQDLTDRVSNLTTEVDSLVVQKEEVMFRSKQLEGENSGLQTRISELEIASKEKEETISALKRKIEENKDHSTSEIEDLMARANSLQSEVETLRSQKQKLEEQVVVKSNEASTQVKGFVDQVNVLQQELQSLSCRKSESESTIEKATQEISDFLLQIENLNEKLASKTMVLQMMLEEKEGLERQVKGLEVEVGSIGNQKRELEEKMRIEKEELHVRITELESDSSTHIKALGVELKDLKQELDSLHAEKTQLELEIEREKQELSEKLALMGKQNIELTSKISQQQTSLEDQKDVINKLNEENKQSKSQYQTAEKKIEETAEEFCKKFEDTLRIISRRIRVAEQLHLENKDVYTKTKEKYEKENTDLKEIVQTTEVAVQKMKEITLTANEALFDLDTVALKFEECSGNFMNRISKASCEVLFAKDWVKRKNNAIKHVQEDVDCLLVQLDAKEAEVLALREKVWKLENKARELEKMVKEKEEGMLGIGEEKREAIRQLCVWIDYHRSRSDYLKKILTEMTVVRSQRTP